MPDEQLDLDSWERYQRFVVEELRRFGTAIKEIQNALSTQSRDHMKEVVTLKVELATLKETLRLQSLLVGGATAGFVSVFVAVATAYVKGH